METPSTAALADALGWGAAVLTLLTFVSGEMRRLRLLALAANAAFIGYGALAGLLPVLALHLALVPVNLWRLNQTFRHARPAHGNTGLAPPRGPRGWMPASRVRRLRRRRPPGEGDPSGRQPIVAPLIVPSHRNGGP